MDFLSSLIGAGTSLLGGIFNRDAAAKTAQRNIDNQNYVNQTQLTFRAQDATNAEKATGINRLALLGVPTSSVSNVVGDTSFGDSIKSAGQDLGRAVAAATAQQSRADQLNEKLLEAKIANVNADTVRMTAAASQIATSLAQPATAVPFPTPDPRGPVIQLYQRARDYRTGDIIDIPSEKAASPLQTIAASPINAAMAARTIGDAVTPDPWFSHALGAARRAVWNSRNVVGY